VHKGIVIVSGLLLYLMSFFCTSSIAYAEIKTIFAEGIARVGESETEVQAKRRAWLDAQQQALEEAGVVLASTTTVTNHELVEDWIQNATLARVQTKLLSETRNFEDNVVVFRVKLACKVNTDDIALLNKELQNLTMAKGPEYTPTKPSNALTSPAVVESVKDFVLQDGSLYTGTVVSGLPDGRGVKFYPDGGKYEGAFRKGYREGSGTMLWTNGDCYHGHWLRDLRSGRGEFVSAHGEKQLGRWLNDLFYED